MSIKQPPFKKRKLNPINSNNNILSSCIWCKDNHTKRDNNHFDEKSNKDDNECNCYKLKTLLESSKCHETITINNTGNTKTSFKTYKLISSNIDNDNLFQINCKNGDIDFNSNIFKNKLLNSFNQNGIIILRNLFLIL